MSSASCWPPCRVEGTFAVLVRGSAPDDADPYDEAVWRATIPTLGLPTASASSTCVRRRSRCGSRTSAASTLRATARPVAEVVDPRLWASLPRIELEPDASVVLVFEHHPRAHLGRRGRHRRRTPRPTDRCRTGVPRGHRPPSGRRLGSRLRCRARRPPSRAPRSREWPPGRWPQSSPTSRRADMAESTRCVSPTSPPPLPDCATWSPPAAWRTWATRGSTTLSPRSAEGGDRVGRRPALWRQRSPVVAAHSGGVGGRCQHLPDPQSLTFANCSSGWQWQSAGNLG